MFFVGDFGKILAGDLLFGVEAYYFTFFYQFSKKLQLEIKIPSAPRWVILASCGDFAYLSVRQLGVLANLSELSFVGVPMGE